MLVVSLIAGDIGVRRLPRCGTIGTGLYDDAVAHSTRASWHRRMFRNISFVQTPRNSMQLREKEGSRPFSASTFDTQSLSATH